MKECVDILEGAEEVERARPMPLLKLACRVFTLIWF